MKANRGIMKGNRIKRLVIILLTAFTAGLLFQACSTQRNSCCNDLNGKYKPPKSHKRNMN